MSSSFLFIAVAASFLIGLYGERSRSALRRRSWKNRRRPRNAPQSATTSARNVLAPLSDPAEQLRTVMAAQFATRSILSKSEARLLYVAERAIAAQRLSWRVMAQVSLGEVLTSPDSRAFASINSKRVDLLLVSRTGKPIAAIEYQGSGHYQGTAPARDAVKKEALRRAGVRYIEITPEHHPDDLVREIARLAETLVPERVKPAPKPPTRPEAGPAPEVELTTNS